ncbi:STAS/SEC14 domain-containing protein [Dokdonia sinensis]|uniref:STAS/SEC14 domain-containing protein n=1 Tax=Dokdonia sinensis TaxID=2479847 RepID=A0A3M0GDN0_9FLAO|nr:STAS/SEC14 domain-containing protein [Dokdonia sinensis]RMB62914.1 STAS/SEC14 domain-containing protein [Dokdonia sinensis]
MIVELNIAGDTVGFVFENAITQGDVKAIQRKIKETLSSNANINLYLEEDEVDDIKMGAFMNQVFFDVKHSANIRKIAIVSDRKWIQAITIAKDILVQANVEAFTLKERVDAICWIMK